jgi:hypothetical protein
VISHTPPGICGRDLATRPGWVGALLFVVLLAADAILITGILRRWRWLFWALLVTFGASAIRVPLLPLQLADLMPGDAPP